MPIQIAMIARITAAYGLTVPSSKLAALVGSLMLSSGATTAGRWMVSSLLRFAPGGQIPAAVISGTVASLTTAIGKAWIEGARGCSNATWRKSAGRQPHAAAIPRRIQETIYGQDFVTEESYFFADAFFAAFSPTAITASIASAMQSVNSSGNSTAPRSMLIPKEHAAVV